MIYEFRTYDLVPGSAPEVMKRFGEAYEKRKEFSELAAFWYTEIGPLNQVIHVWPYEDTNQRDEIRAAAVASGNWPPKIRDFIVNQHVEIMKPWPFSIPGTQERWLTKLEERTAMSPLSAVFSVDIGSALKMVHIWPYQSLQQRHEVRTEAREKEIWPPKGSGDGPPYFSQENKILLPAPFSPMQ